MGLFYMPLFGKMYTTGSFWGPGSRSALRAQIKTLGEITPARDGRRLLGASLETGLDHRRISGI